MGGHRRRLLDHDDVIHALLRPEATGFIRRWLLLCRIDKRRPSVPIRTFEMERWVIGIRRPGEPGSKSLTAFAERTGRQVPKLSRTLRMMESYGLGTLKQSVREIEPIAGATSVKVLIN
mgnify:FL=1